MKLTFQKNWGILFDAIKLMALRIRGKKSWPVSEDTKVEDIEYFKKENLSMRKVISFIMIVVTALLAAGCSKTVQNQENSTSQESVNMKIDQDDQEEQGQLEYVEKVKVYPADEPEGKVYHWVILQNGRRTVNEEIMEKVNHRLKELNLDGSLQIHVVDIKKGQYVTKEIIEEVYQELNGKMDFISISPAMIALSKENWGELFIDLTEELKEGKLKDFYQAVPENLWSVNRIAGKLYSFSNAKTPQIMVAECRKKFVEEMGAENLCKLRDANGLENEEIWKELYQIREAPVCAWYMSIYGSSRIDGNREEEPRSTTLNGFTNGWQKQYFSEVTDDIQYNFKTERFEWLGESETYRALLEKMIEYYEKGYIREWKYEALFSDDAEDFFNQIAMEKIGLDDSIVMNVGILDEYGEREEGGMLVPLWQQKRIGNRYKNAYVYSCVYQEAQEGWESILNAMGSDEELTLLLTYGIEGKDFEREEGIVVEPKNYKTFYYTLILSSELYPERSTVIDYKQKILETGNMYTFLEDIYGGVEESQIDDFVFNPEPVGELLKECNDKALLVSILPCSEKKLITREDGIEDESYVFSIELLKAKWENYLEIMRDSPVRAVTEELNRQLKEWVESE